MEAAPRIVRFRDYALWLALGILALTLTFAAQQAMRRGMIGLPPDWGAAFALNGLDWVVWGALVPLIVAVGQRARLGGSGNTAARIAVWAALGIVCVLVVSIVAGLALYTWPALFGSPPPRGQTPPIRQYLANWTAANSTFNTLIFGVIAGVLHAALAHRDLQARRLRQAELEARLTRSELTVLRMQLQPHFFFNALHTVSSLMVSDVPAAQGVVSSLGTLLRASIDHTARQEIALGEELEFVRHYLDVQTARFRQRLSVRVDVDRSLHEALVPSLVLQPLVENAIRHGIEPSPLGGTIWIGAERRDGNLELTVRDEVAGAPIRQTTANGGVGLANIEARLAQLYGPTCRFRAGRDHAGHFTVTMTLPFHTDEGLFPAAATAR